MRVLVDPLCRSWMARTGELSLVLYVCCCTALEGIDLLEMVHGWGPLNVDSCSWSDVSSEMSPYSLVVAGAHPH